MHPDAIDASFLSPTRKRQAVEAGSIIKYPWAGNAKTLAMNASDIMGESSTPYVAELELSPDAETDVDAVHTAYIVPVTLAD